MQDVHDLGLILDSRVPLVAIQSNEENRVLDLLMLVTNRRTLPLQVWSATDGLRPMGFAMGEPGGDSLTDPEAALQAIKKMDYKGVFVLCDVHPFLNADNPRIVRLLKDIMLQYERVPRTVILLSHQVEPPPELRRHCAWFELSVPGDEQILGIIREEAQHWSSQNSNQRVKTDRETLDKIVSNLRGLAEVDVRRLARGLIFDDGAISDEDLPEMNKAKFGLMDMHGVLSYEYSTEQFSNVGGLSNLKSWLAQRKQVFLGAHAEADTPKGILLLGVQGSGKSLAAKAVAGLWGLPLLRLDFGALYNKYYGESERNLREAIKLAELMSPCVMWFDEIEKGVSRQGHDDGTSQRVLGTLLTWMSERAKPVFVVATSNDISRLPPELIRKGRLDEIFFVDLPDAAVREEIMAIHLRKRKQDPQQFDLHQLAVATEGFSGAEIEQAVVAALYTVMAQEMTLDTAVILNEISRTRPIAVVMAEEISVLREWARDRTVSAG